MRRIVWIVLVLVAIIGIYVVIFNDSTKERVRITESQEGQDQPDLSVVAENLSVPWEVVFFPGSKDYLVTERPGNLIYLRDGERISITVDSVRASGEGGLLGATLHPDFESNNYLYLYETTEVPRGLSNRVVRYEFVQEGILSNPEVIIDEIPGARYHDGGRIEFGPRGYLYITTGDAGDENSAQDISSLAGKILRLNADGSIPEDNPFDNPVWSYGHRNPQGLAWDDQERLWSTEHGRSGLRSGYDELNLIQSGGNYGWPIIQGPESRDGMISPVLQSGASTTWAPASLAYHAGKLYWAGLRGQTLYSAVVEGERVGELEPFLAGDFGRLRAVEVTPDGDDLWITTSNTDGRGNPREGDDRIISIPLQSLPSS